MLLQTCATAARRRPTCPDALIRRLSAAYEIGGTQLSISATVGISMLLPRTATAPTSYCATPPPPCTTPRSGGRGTHLFYAPHMLGQPAEALQQEHLLRAAVPDALRLHYQPQIEVSTGRLTGFEALVRWQHPETACWGRTSSSPGRVAAWSPIGRWVLREACRQIKAWQDEGLARVPVAVNVGREFRQRDLVGEIKRCWLTPAWTRSTWRSRSPRPR